MKRHLLSSTVLAVCLILAAGVVPAAAQTSSTCTWFAEYFNNKDWAGAPVFTQCVGWISLDWGQSSPNPAVVPVDNFTGRFSTNAYFYASNYTFSIIADDEFVLIVDGQTYLDTRNRGQSGKPQSLTVGMWEGYHSVQVLYREYTLTANIWVNWAPSGGGPTPPPDGQTWPPLPASAPPHTTDFGDYTQCAEKPMHQENCFQQNGSWGTDKGSIHMEPQIQSWKNCSPADKDQTFYVSPQEPAKGYRCSKTLAGWFPR